MNRKLLLVLCLLVGFVFMLELSVFAQPPFHKRLKAVDRNKDGVVDKKERVMEKKQRSKVNRWWEERADTDNDGVVDPYEMMTWKKLQKSRIDLDGDGEISAKEKRLTWRHVRSRVNTALEKKYDTNADGWLEQSEVKEMLKDRYALIKTKGKAKVDSLIEEEYDSDNDGIISAEEAEIMRQDVGE